MSWIFNPFTTMFQNVFVKPLRKSELYLFADGLEIFCLSNEDRSISKSGYERILRYGNDFIPEDEAEEVNADVNTTYCNDIFHSVQQRIETIGDDYPFAYDEETEMFSLKDEVSNGGKLYIVLLLTANLGKLRENRVYFTSFLEIVGFRVIEELFPGAQVRLFGSSNSDMELVPHFESKKLNERLIELSHFINQPAKGIELIADNNLGDNGLDIVAKVPVNDELSSQPLVFAQCASSNEEWSYKQQDISRAKWSHFLDYADTSVIQFMFIPQLYRDLDGNWFDHRKVIQTVLMDRFRICAVVSELNYLSQTKAFESVEHMLAG